MNVSEAPPPVERKPTWSHSPSSSRALALSPPPTTEKPGHVATASATSGSRRRNGGPRTHRAARSTARCRRGDGLGEGRGRLGPDVETGPAVGQVALDDLDAAPWPVAVEGGPKVPPGLEGPGVGREEDVDAGVEERPAVGHVDSSSRELPTPCPRRPGT